MNTFFFFLADHCSTLRHHAHDLALARPLDRAGELFTCLSSERLLRLLDCLQASYQVRALWGSAQHVRVCVCVCV